VVIHSGSGLRFEFGGNGHFYEAVAAGDFITCEEAQSNVKPHVSAVISSDSVRGYFLQFSGRNRYTLQYDLSSASNLRNGQTLGSLQHAPQATHRPLRFLATGSKQVKVRLVLARHVFLLF
jgi:hypothetical protein